MEWFAVIIYAYVIIVCMMAGRPDDGYWNSFKKFMMKIMDSKRRRK